MIDRCNQSVDVPCQKIISLFVACLSVFILIRRGFEENGSRQEKKMRELLHWNPYMCPKTYAGSGG